MPDKHPYLSHSMKEAIDMLDTATREVKQRLFAQQKFIVDLLEDLREAQERIDHLTHMNSKLRIRNPGYEIGDTVYLTRGITLFHGSMRDAIDLSKDQELIVVGFHKDGVLVRVPGRNDKDYIVPDHLVTSKLDAVKQQVRETWETLLKK